MMSLWDSPALGQQAELVELEEDVTARLMDSRYDSTPSICNLPQQVSGRNRSLTVQAAKRECQYESFGSMQ